MSVIQFSSSKFFVNKLTKNHKVFITKKISKDNLLSEVNTLNRAKNLSFKIQESLSSFILKLIDHLIELITKKMISRLTFLWTLSKQKMEIAFVSITSAKELLREEFLNCCRMRTTKMDRQLREDFDITKLINPINPQISYIISFEA